MADPHDEPLATAKRNDVVYITHSMCMSARTCCFVKWDVDLACRVLLRAESIFVDVSDAVAYAEHALLIGQKSDEHTIA